MSGLIDSHCHLTYPELSGQIDAVLKRAIDAGVTEFVTIATDIVDAEKAIVLAAKCASVHVVCGIHPHQAARATAGWQSDLHTLLQRDNVHAVGEMGLDYHYDFSDHDSQRHVFRAQLELASDIGKPVVIHCREAHDNVLAALADFPSLRGVVFHCFTGTIAQAREILDGGYWLSLTGVVTFKRSDELRDVARMLPADRIMVETDAPYLSPEPVRHVRPNEPAHLVHTAAVIASARGMTLPELTNLTESNTRRFFNLPAAAHD